MDPKELDFVSKQLGIGQGWGQNFFVSCLLQLSPEDLKACGIVEGGIVPGSSLSCLNNSSFHESIVNLSTKWPCIHRSL